MERRRGRVSLVLAAGLLASCAAPYAPPRTGTFQVVALGDSYASGQGAPDRPFNRWRFWEPVGWADRRCNRSNYAAAAQAVKSLEQAGHSVGLEPFTCSGASIDEGLLNPYMGSEPDPGDLPLAPQLAQLKDYAQAHPVGAVVISAGGNDIYFEKIVLACMASACDLVKATVDQRLALLPGLLDAMAGQLAEIPNLDPASVLLVEYPDPARGADGSYCNRKPDKDAFRLIRQKDARWAGACVLPRLDHEICMAAHRHGFRYVAGVSPRFQAHGYCAQPQNFINSVTESESRQLHYRGGMHPNVAGHAEIGAEIAAVLEQVMAGEAPPEGSCPPLPDPAQCE